MVSLNPISFGMLFSFSFISKHLLSFFLFNFFTSWFKRVLFNFHIFVNLLIFLLLLTSCVIPLWLEKMLCIISASLNLLYFELTYRLPWWSPMCTWEKCVFCYWCWVMFIIKSGLMKTLLNCFFYVIYMCICVSLELLLYAHMFIIVVSSS